MPKTVQHTWRERTEEGLRLVRAFRRGGEWHVLSKPSGDEYWLRHDPVPLEDLRNLRDVLWRKYQRKRVAWEAVVEIDRMIEDFTGEKEKPE